MNGPKDKIDDFREELEWVFQGGGIAYYGGTNSQFTKSSGMNIMTKDFCDLLEVYPDRLGLPIRINF
jgi:hypothetical protein